MEDPGFRVTDHVVEGPTVARPELREAVAQLFEQRLDRSRPLWRLDVVGLREGGAALVWRIHHALADGTTSVRWARELLWDRCRRGARRGPRRARRRTTRQAARPPGRLPTPRVRRARHASPFDGTIGTRRQVALATAPLGALHQAARSLAGATLNDAVLTSIAGGVRRWIEAHHGALGTIRVRVPVSLHHEGDDAGNRDSFFSVALPLGEPDPVARLEAVRAPDRASARPATTPRRWTS